MDLVVENLKKKPTKKKKKGPQVTLIYYWSQFIPIARPKFLIQSFTVNSDGQLFELFKIHQSCPC